MRATAAFCRPLALAGVLVLGACATGNAPQPPVTDISSRACAATFDLSKAVPLTIDAKKETATTKEIDGTADCIKDTAGVAAYVVYALPQADAPYVIAVSSVPESSTLFAPRILLLGSDGAVKREFSGDAVKFRGTGLGAMFRSHTDEIYLVVASDPANTGKTNSRIVEATQVYTGYTGYGTYQVHTGSETNAIYVLSHNGRVVVTLTPILPAK